jgi:hypothetical protein
MPKQQLGTAFRWLCYSLPVWARALLSRAGRLRRAWA